MPQRRVLVLLAFLAAVALAGPGCVYVNTRTPFDTDLDRTDLGSKVGTADAYSLLWLVSWGDAGYGAAAENGGIKVLKHADQELTSVLIGLFVHWKVIVYGD